MARLSPAMVRGYFHVLRIKGVAFRLHWTAPVGLFALGGFGFAPIVWASLLFIIVVHECGHAILAHAVGMTPLSIEVHGLGGRCSYVGSPTAAERSTIAWGGVLAQGLLLLLTWRIGELFAELGSGFAQAIGLLISANAMILVLNLVPVPGLDGAQAWRLFRWRHVKDGVERVGRTTRRLRRRVGVPAAARRP
jgi:Zn-dependent protease